MKKQKFQGKAVEVTVNNKEEKSFETFVQEFGLRKNKISGATPGTGEQTVLMSGATLEQIREFLNSGATRGENQTLLMSPCHIRTRGCSPILLPGGNP